MSHRFLHINSMSYEPESDVVTLDFSACRIGHSALLYGFAEPIQIPINIWLLNQTYTFSCVLDASTQSISDTTTFEPSFAKIDFNEVFEKDTIVNLKLLGRYLIKDSGYKFTKKMKRSDGIKEIINNLVFENETSGFSASVQDDSLIITSPERTGVYYNGFTIQLLINNSMQSFTFSNGITKYELSFGTSKYYLTI